MAPHMTEPRFKTLEQIYEHVEKRSPCLPSEHDIVDEWIKETKAYIQKHNENKNNQSGPTEKSR